MKMKKTALTKLMETSTSAIKVLTDTLDTLKRTNDAIENEKLNIATKIADLTEESKSLSDLRDKNARIISNFEALLN